MMNTYFIPGYIERHKRDACGARRTASRHGRQRVAEQILALRRRLRPSYTGEIQREEDQCSGGSQGGH